MKKNKQKGFMLVETLVVTTFISGVFLFLFIQFNNLNKSYKYSFKYDSVEGLYALDDVVDYLNDESLFKSNLATSLSDDNYIKLSNCSSNLFSSVEYCNKLFELEEIREAIIVKKDYEINSTDSISENIKEYLNKVNKKNRNNYNYLIIIELLNDNIVSKYIDL